MNCVWVRVGNVRMDIPCDEAQDGVWRLPFALVLATDLVPKRQRPYRERRLKAVLMRAQRRDNDGKYLKADFDFVLNSGL